ncbi:hypothetical protein PR202_gb06364 [Eleusine coracana subsp. coracana]|uniref:Uncharacterized protein n=1 Tax=Eleusine coracana subsp. coracana TaxID=191504 RepID=A0AAV5E6X7_ELECO|nr:hypothetical protein PR202_gb06364 [Eleusine coracana subsp. coracana]
MAGPHRSARDRPPRRLGVPVSHHLASLSRSRSTTNNHSDHTHSSLELAHSSFTSCGAAPRHQPPPRAMDPAAADPPCIIQALRAHTPAPPPYHHHWSRPSGPRSTPGPSPPARRRRFLLPATQAPAHPTAATTTRPRTPEPAPHPLGRRAGVDPRRDAGARGRGGRRGRRLVPLRLRVPEVGHGGREPRIRPRAPRGKRAAAECRRRWEARWRRSTAPCGGGRCARGARTGRWAPPRGGAPGSPPSFDAEVYGAMDALIRVEEALLADAVGGAGGAGAGGGGEGLVGGGAGVEVRGEDGGGEAEVAEDDGKEEDGSADEEEDQDDDDDDDDDGEEEGEEEMQADAGNADAPNNNSGVGRVAETNNKAEKSQNTAWELANKLQENAQHIQTILNEEPDKYAAQNHTVAYSTSPDAMVTTRQKADELIKSLGGLLSYLNQFTELVKETGFEKCWHDLMPWGGRVKD